MGICGNRYLDFRSRFHAAGSHLFASGSRFFRPLGVGCTLKNMTFGLYIRILAPGSEMYFKFGVFKQFKYMAFFFNVLI